MADGFLICIQDPEDGPHGVHHGPNLIDDGGQDRFGVLTGMDGLHDPAKGVEIAGLEQAAANGGRRLGGHGVYESHVIVVEQGRAVEIDPQHHAHGADQLEREADDGSDPFSRGFGRILNPRIMSHIPDDDGTILENL